jgi:FixJ family two-component response regulator
MNKVESNLSQTVFIVDDDPAICAGLSDLLESTGLRTQHYSSAEEFLENWKPGAPGCLVLDVRLSGMSGMELHAKLAESDASIPVIVMTAHGDMPMVRKALKAGAVEFLIKPFQDEELLQAVEHAFARDREQRRATGLMNSIRARAETLTDREREVMKLVAAGLTNKEIAEKLYLSVVTIKLHRGQVMRKMHAKSLADLVRMSEKINPIPNSASGGAN